LGLSGTYTGIGLAISMVFDAVSDPVVGSWSDGLKSRWGRRHPFMFFAVVPLALSFFGLFWPPAGLSEFTLFLWFTVFSILMRTALSVFQVPYMSLGVELTQNYEERTSIALYRYFIGPIATLAITAIAWNFFFVSSEDNPTPQLTREPYFAYALLSAIIMMVVMFGAIWGTKEAIPHLAGSDQEGRQFSFRRVYRDLIGSLTSPPFRALFLSLLVLVIYLGGANSLGLHMQTFFWKLDTQAIQYWQYAYLIAGLVSVPLFGPIIRWMDKRGTMIFVYVLTMLALTGPVVLALLGWLPTDPAILVPILVTFSFLYGVAAVGTNIVIFSMIGDIADEHELRTGTRQEGVFFGSMNFIEKCTTAIGFTLAGLAIDFIRLDPQSLPGEVSNATIQQLGMVHAAFVIFGIVSLLLYLPYNISRKSHVEIVRALEQKRREEAE